MNRQHSRGRSAHLAPLVLVALAIGACTSEGTTPGPESGGTPSAGGSAGAATTGGTSGNAGAVTTGGTSGNAGAVATGGTSGAPTEPALRFVGRFDFSDTSAPAFEWSGSEIQARFSGTELSVSLSGSSNVFVAEVDGQAEKIDFAGGDQVLALATGLAPGEHEVRLSRVTEAFFWTTQFRGFDFGAGTLLAPPPAPARRLEVVGDSISAGYGIEGDSASCSFSAATENHYLTYQALTARTLGADLITLAWSGIGMYRNSGGDMVDPRMPERYLETLPAAGGAPWNFDEYVPHAVVINLGTNDFSGGDPGAPFADAYTAFVNDMRGRYPDAMIYLATSPMLGDSDQALQRVHLQTVVDARQAASDTRVRILEFPTQLAADGYGCDWHPSAATNVRLATILTATLQTDLGW